MGIIAYLVLVHLANLMIVEFVSRGIEKWKRTKDAPQLITWLKLPPFSCRVTFYGAYYAAVIRYLGYLADFCS